MIDSQKETRTMDALEAIQTRRSIRRYTSQPVDDETMEQILRAAMMAPSARNQQPWHFVVLRDAETLRKIPESCPNAAMVAGAPAAVLVCADEKLEQTPGYLPQDCAAAVQNMLLAAHAMGLGAVWCGIHPRPKREAALRELCGLPEHVLPHSLVVLGHPGERPKQPDRFLPERIHQEEW
jgi:nitroreductase